MKTKPLPTMSDDFGHEVTEARVLPLGGGGNIICGLEGYRREIANRRHMNRTLDASAKWDLPTWESLRVYFPESVAELQTPPPCPLHTPGYYWKQTAWNRYTLVTPKPTGSQHFDSYEKLEAYCKRNGIDAAQA